MIIAMLQSDLDKRPQVKQCFKYEFLHSNFVPKPLPSSCLTMAPHADQLEGSERDMGLNRKPLLELDKDGNEMYMTAADYPRPLDKKMKLLSYF